MALTLLAMSTSGCVTASSEACPHIVDYPTEIQAQGDAELQALPETGVVRSRFMPDYGALRDGTRACLKAQK